MSPTEAAEAFKRLLDEPERLLAAPRRLTGDGRAGTGRGPLILSRSFSGRLTDPAMQGVTDVTIIRLSDRLAKLEQRLDPRPDPHHAAEARQRLIAGIDGVMRNLAAGQEPDNEVGRWIVAYDGNVVTALEALVEFRRAADVARGRASNRGQR